MNFRQCISDIYRNTCSGISTLSLAAIVFIPPLFMFACTSTLNPDMLNEPTHDNLIIIFGILIIILSLIAIISSRYIKFRLNKKYGADKQKLNYDYEEKMTDLEKQLNELENSRLDKEKELKFKQNEMVSMAMNIIYKNELLTELKTDVTDIKNTIKDLDARDALNKLSLKITRNLSIDRDREKFQMHLNEQNSIFLHNLTESYPTLTDNEKRLAILIRLNLSSKEIASILNISTKSVEMNRYRLRKKLKVSSQQNLHDFISAI